MASKRLSLFHSQTHASMEGEKKFANTTIWPLFGKFCTSSKWSVEKYNRAPNIPQKMYRIVWLQSQTGRKKKLSLTQLYRIAFGYVLCVYETLRANNGLHITRPTKCERAGFYETRIHIFWAHVPSIFFENFLPSNRTNLACNDVHRVKMFCFFLHRMC